LPWTAARPMRSIVLSQVRVSLLMVMLVSGWW
jgi:hypothetical protein